MVSVPLGATVVFGGGPTVETLALVFIALQLTLSYCASGVAKFFGTTWRSGSAVGGVLRTATWGIPIVSLRLDAHPVLSRYLTWSVMTGEALFPVAVVLGGPVGFAVLSVYVLFHTIVASVMGLNRFTLWFLSAYPAVVFVMDRYALT